MILPRWSGASSEIRATWLIDSLFVFLNFLSFSASVISDDIYPAFNLMSTKSCKNKYHPAIKNANVCAIVITITNVDFINIDGLSIQARITLTKEPGHVSN